jgi:hypothetical protein
MHFDPARLITSILHKTGYTRKDLHNPRFLRRELVHLNNWLSVVVEDMEKKRLEEKEHDSQKGS